MTISPGTKESLSRLVGSLTNEAKEYLDVALYASFHDESETSQDEEFASAAIVDMTHALADIKDYLENLEELTEPDDLINDIAQIMDYHGVDYDSL